MSHNYNTLAVEVKNYAKNNNVTLTQAKKAMGVNDWQYAYSVKKLRKSDKNTKTKTTATPVKQAAVVKKSEPSKMIMIVGTPEEIARAMKNFSL